jgi:hypothetical protein
VPGRIFKPDTVSVMPKAAMIDFAMRQWHKFEDPVVQPYVVCHSHIPGKAAYALHPNNDDPSDTLLATRVAYGWAICPSWVPAQVPSPAA